jgi:hypothetical protein
MAARQFVEEDGRFERRTGQAVFDARHGVPQVEQSRGTLAFSEQAPQATPQHAGSGQVRFPLFSPEQEDRRLIGQGADGGIELSQILADIDRGHH